ncbi:MAG: hypothetical protein ACOC7U_10855, partial [Spirochaetota bacterium]
MSLKYLFSIFVLGCNLTLMKMKVKNSIKKGIVVLSAAVIGAGIYGCGRIRLSGLSKEHLFKIPIGNGWEEIGVTKAKNYFEGPGTIVFKNGFYFLVDSVNQKIMKVTTPGDIIMVLKKGQI